MTAIQCRKKNDRQSMEICNFSTRLDTSIVESVRGRNVQMADNIMIARQKMFGSWCNYESMTEACLCQRQDGEADGRVHIVELEKEVGALCGAQPKVAGDWSGQF
jgi:hypothetical protein